MGAVTGTAAGVYGGGVGGGSGPALVEIAVRFHEAICTFARHKRLLHIWRSMIAQTSHSARVAGHFQADLQRDVAPHQEVLDALRTGDPNVAESTIKRHVQHAGHQLLRGAIQVGLLMTAGTSAVVREVSDTEWARLLELEEGSMS